MLSFFILPFLVQHAAKKVWLFHFIFVFQGKVYDFPRQMRPKRSAAHRTRKSIECKQKHIDCRRFYKLCVCGFVHVCSNHSALPSLLFSFHFYSSRSIPLSTVFLMHFACSIVMYFTVYRSRAYNFFFLSNALHFPLCDGVSTPRAFPIAS